MSVAGRFFQRKFQNNRSSSCLVRRFLGILVAATLLASTGACVDKNGNSILFKRGAWVDTPNGWYQLVKPLGIVPWNLIPTVSGQDWHADWSRDPVFLPFNTTEAAVVGDYNIHGSTIVVISTPTSSCQYDYTLITFLPNRQYFARRMEPCTRDLVFSSDGNGVTAIELGVPDPQLWWISNTSYTGPVRQSALAALAPVAPPSPTAKAPKSHPAPPKPVNNDSFNAMIDKLKSAGAASSHLSADAAPSVSAPIAPTPPQAPVAHPAPVQIADAEYTPAKRLQQVSQVATPFSLAHGGTNEKPIPLCLTDQDTTCAR